MAKHLLREFDRVKTLQDRLADIITSFAGSMIFVYLHAIIFAFWIGFNLVSPGFDPFPFGLLTLIVSLEAIFLATFVMISQNLQSKQAEVRAQLDYEINLKAEQEVAEIKAQLERIVKTVESNNQALRSK